MLKAPNPEIEYILTFDYKNAFRDIVVPKDTVVTNVTYTGSMLYFTVKDTGKTHSTFYGYMFAENTPENLKRLAIAREKREHYFRARKEIDEAYNAVDSILGPFEKC